MRRQGKRAGRKKNKVDSALEFNHVMIYVESVETALAFYSALGFREVDQFAGGGWLVSERLRSS